MVTFPLFEKRETVAFLTVWSITLVGLKVHGSKLLSFFVRGQALYSSEVMGLHKHFGSVINILYTGCTLLVLFEFIIFFPKEKKYSNLFYHNKRNTLTIKRENLPCSV